MKLTRKRFLYTATGAATFAAMPFSGTLASPGKLPVNDVPAEQSGKPKRGVSAYCYSGVLNWNVTLEDVFIDMYDMRAKGLELLANAHIEGYPNPTDKWMEWWQSMLKKYEIVPVEYGHWVDSRLHKGRELTTKESYDMLVRDIKLAHKLGFTVGRTKLGVIDRPGTPEYDTLTPVKNWREFIEMALPVAKENNFVMCPEIHNPTLLKSKMIDDYVEFIEKTNTKNFGLNIDFGVFQNKPRPGATPNPARPLTFSKPEEIIPLLPYVHACHAKFVDISEDCVDTTTPYAEVIDIMIKNKWDGYLLSEFEGANKDVPGVAAEQLRRQHVMLKRLLGEV
jgi:hypothetical protein